MTKLTEQLTEQFVESFKEGLRVFLMAVVPLVVVELETNNGFDYRFILTAGVIAVLRFVDKILYLNQKEAKTPAKLEAEWKGLTGF